MLIHASAESANGTIPHGTFAVALSSPDEERLLKLERRLRFEQVPHAAFREPDYNNQLMSIGIEPIKNRHIVRRLLKNFTLFGDHYEK